MHLGGMEELWCPFHKWETICMYQYRPTGRPVSISVANGNHRQNSGAVWRTDSAKKEITKFSLGLHYTYRALRSRQSELREAEGNTKQFTGFPNATILAAEGSQTRWIECANGTCAYRLILLWEKVALENLSFHCRKPLVMIGMHEVLVLSLGVNCPWAVPGVKSAEAGAFEQRLRTWGDQERKRKAGAIAGPLAF